VIGALVAERGSPIVFALPMLCFARNGERFDDLSMKQERSRLTLAVYENAEDNPLRELVLMPQRILVLGTSFGGGNWPPLAAVAVGLHEAGAALALPALDAEGVPCKSVASRRRPAL
jgi:hypothetical protein